MRHVIAAAAGPDRRELCLRRLLCFGWKNRGANNCDVTDGKAASELMPTNSIHVSSLKTLGFLRANVARAQSKVKMKILPELQSLKLDRLAVALRVSDHAAIVI
jgi:hypothetical protein